jgi:hypothetical protein
MAIEDGVDGADGRDPDIAGQAPNQEFFDLASAPMRFPCPRASTVARFPLR